MLSTFRSIFSIIVTLLLHSFVIEARLTKEDLDDVASIVSASETRVKALISASETRVKALISASETRVKALISASESRLSRLVVDEGHLFLKGRLVNFRLKTLR